MKDRCEKCGHKMVKEPDGERWCPSCEPVVDCRDDPKWAGLYDDFRQQMKSDLAKD